MDIFQVSLVIAAFLCSLIAGFLFAFAIVVMPGIRSLNHGEFIRAFQAIDRIIQKGQPVFIFAWVGSIIALLTSAVFGVIQLNGAARFYIILATLVYLLCVQLPTIMINVPLNNKLQTLVVEDMNETEQKAAREHFESRWNRWNAIRAFFSSFTSVLLIILLFML